MNDASAFGRHWGLSLKEIGAITLNHRSGGARRRVGFGFVGDVLSMGGLVQPAG